jgi:hypothetical protein
MTKVFFPRSMGDYRREMAESVRQVIKENFIAGVKTYVGEEPPLAAPDLLPPPKIETIFLDIYHGQVDEEIMMAISDDFGIASVQIILRDEKGNVIEGGQADPFCESPDCWSDVTTVPVPSGTHVIVRAAATDCLGGVGVCSAGKTIP